MKTRKILSIMLALLLVLGMSMAVFADEETDEDPNGTSAGELITEEDDDDEGEDEDATDAAPPAVTSNFVIPVPNSVVVSTQVLTVDGVVADVQPYNIDNSNYFKLRDLAALMTGTGSQFNVTYEAPNIIVTTGEAYEPQPDDLVKGEDMSATCVPSGQTMLVDGEQVDILAYNIGNNNYFQLRGLGELVGFSVDYDDATRTMIVETEGFEPGGEITGAYSADRAVTEEDLVIFEEGIEEFVENVELLIEPTLVATQIVNGTNYRFTATVTPPGLDPPYEVYVYIFQPLEGPAEFVDLVDVDDEDDEGEDDEE